MKKKTLLRLAVLLSLAIPIGVRAQTGDNNPTGVSGQFNGNVTTAGSYDPLTGNSTRSITDLTVPSAVGKYPLAFTRTMNTRDQRNNAPGAGFPAFGEAGGWRHSHQWAIERIVLDGPETARPSTYSVHYPDGRRITFSGDPNQGISFAPGSPGISDRFQQLPADQPIDFCYLLLSDGGKIEFEAKGYTSRGANIVDPPPETLTIVYHLSAIIDPFGQVSPVEGEDDGIDGNFQVTKVTDPTGERSLSLVYEPGPAGDQVITRVEERLSSAQNAPATRTVAYRYAAFGGVSALVGVNYFGDSSLDAVYTYQNSVLGTSGPPLIQTCSDSMYGGAMANIAYEFETVNAAYGQIKSEKYYDPATGTIGSAVSTLTVSGDQRTETRGDGPSRTFNYQVGYLQNWKDFKGASFAQGHTQGPSGFISSLTEPQRTPQFDYTTRYQRHPVTGLVTGITYPLTPSDENGAPGSAAIGYGASPNFFYIVSQTDANNHPTTYTRDPATQQVTDIAYPDLAHEGFSYNGFGQVLVHQRKNGFYEHMSYDGRGLLQSASNPDTNSGVEANADTPRTRFLYYPLGDAWADRVKTVIDPRGNRTTYEYEVTGAGTPIRSRGLISKIILPRTVSASSVPDPYKTFTYDRLGNLKRTENELRQPVEYDYDDYSRMTEMRVARPSIADPAVRDGWMKTTYDYTPETGDAYSRTANVPTTVTTPATADAPTGRVTKNTYDANLRLKTSTQVDSVEGNNSALTQFDYDEVGNRNSVTDPNGNQTEMMFDPRNRRSKATSPEVDVEGAIPSRAQLVTQWFYDPAGNVRLLIQPDETPDNLRRQIFTYDEMNRVQTATDAEDRVTTNRYHPSGQLKSVLDPKGQLTQFDYDERDLKKEMIYPGGQDYMTGWAYDENGNLKTRPTITRTINGAPVVGPKQLFTYDARNRPETMRWDNGIDFSNFGYDAANRMTSAINPNAAITREYDVAGRLTLDRQVFPSIQNTIAPPPVVPDHVYSRKTHGAAGEFDLELNLSDANPGIECRSGGAAGAYTLVLDFGYVPVSVQNVTVSSGTGLVANPHPAPGTTLIVNLTGVSDAQLLSVTFTGLSNGIATGDLVVPMRVLVGDVNGNGSVNASDKSQVEANIGVPVSRTTFKSDLNTSGTISGSDLAMVKAASGSGLPAQGPPSQTVDVTYQYGDDSQVNKLAVAETDYHFDFGYDQLGRFERIGNSDFPGNTTYQYYYDRASNVLERMNNFSHTSQVSVPDELNRVKGRITQARREVNGMWQLYEFSHESYGYDRMSRVVKTKRDEDNNLSDRFAYNKAGELVRVDYESQGRFEEFALDRAGNRNSVDANGMILPWGANQLNQYTQAGAYAVTNGSQHEIIGYQAPSFENVNYTLLGDGPLASASSVSQGTYTVGYDALGRTVRRTTNGQTTYYAFDGARAILEIDASVDKLQAAIGANALYGIGIDEIIARQNHGQEQFLQQDRLGSTTAITNYDGQVMESYRYDAFGSPQFYGPASGSGAAGAPLLNGTMINNRYLFTGREWVQRFGFYEYRARAYNPRLGRFMSEDPLGFAAGDTNLFRYAGGDPVNFVDPSGLADDPIYQPLEISNHHSPPAASNLYPAGNLDSLTQSLLNGTPSSATSATAGTPSRSSSSGNGIIGGGVFGGSFGGGITLSGSGSSGSFSAGSGAGASLSDGGGGAGQKVATFYRQHGTAFNNAINSVFGANAVYVPYQTYGNAPSVDRSFTGQQLYLIGITRPSVRRPARQLSSGKAGAMTLPRRSADGLVTYTIYISNNSSIDFNRSYAHELGNLLSFQLTGLGTAFGDPSGDGDHDTGAAVELEMFGP